MADLNRIFNELQQKLEANPDRWKEMEISAQFDLSGEGGGTYHLVLSGGKADAGPGAPESPKVTLSMASDTFERLIGGQLNATAAFMSGQLRIQGDMGMAMKLQGLLQ